MSNPLAEFTESEQSDILELAGFVVENDDVRELALEYTDVSDEAMESLWKKLYEFLNPRETP